MILSAVLSRDYILFTFMMLITFSLSLLLRLSLYYIIFQGLGSKSFTFPHKSFFIKDDQTTLKTKYICSHWKSIKLHLRGSSFRAFRRGTHWSLSFWLVVLMCCRVDHLHMWLLKWILASYFDSFHPYHMRVISEFWANINNIRYL